MKAAQQSATSDHLSEALKLLSHVKEVRGAANPHLWCHPGGRANESGASKAQRA